MNALGVMPSVDALSDADRSSDGSNDADVADGATGDGIEAEGAAEKDAAAEGAAAAAVEGASNAATVGASDGANAVAVRSAPRPTCVARDAAVLSASGGAFVLEASTSAFSLRGVIGLDITSTNFVWDPVWTVESLFVLPY